jgi:spermidine synthase
MKPFELLAQTHSPDGTAIQLKRRDDEFVIFAGGRHLMSSRTHASEDSLATFGCRHITAAHPHHPIILIGGLGMGFTLRAALDVLPPRATIIVAELIPEIVDWNRGPLAHLAANPLADPRVKIEIADVATLITRETPDARTASSQKFDAILLDVDNSPAAFTDSANAHLYSAQGLAAAHASLTPGGTFALWSATATEDRDFTHRLRSANFTVHIERTRAHANNKGPRHTIYLAYKPQNSQKSQSRS